MFQTIKKVVKIFTESPSNIGLKEKDLEVIINEDGIETSPRN